MECGWRSVLIVKGEKRWLVDAALFGGSLPPQRGWKRATTQTTSSPSSYTIGVAFKVGCTHVSLDGCLSLLDSRATVSTTAVKAALTPCELQGFTSTCSRLSYRRSIHIST